MAVLGSYPPSLTVCINQSLIVSFNCCVFYLGIKFIPKKKKVTTEMYVIVVANSYSLGATLLLAAQISSNGLKQVINKECFGQHYRLS